MQNFYQYDVKLSTYVKKYFWGRCFLKCQPWLKTSHPFFSTVKTACTRLLKLVWLYYLYELWNNLLFREMQLYNYHATSYTLKSMHRWLLLTWSYHSLKTLAYTGQHLCTAWKTVPEKRKNGIKISIQHKFCYFIHYMCHIR